MKSIQNTGVNTPMNSYKGTKKGAMIGAGVGTAVVGLAAAGTAIMAKGLQVMPRADKKGFIETMRNVGVKGNIMKNIKGDILKGSIKRLAILTAVGAGIGLAVDALKNKKVEPVEQAKQPETAKEAE